MFQDERIVGRVLKVNLVNDVHHEKYKVEIEIVDTKIVRQFPGTKIAPAIHTTLTWLSADSLERVRKINVINVLTWLSSEALEQARKYDDWDWPSAEALRQVKVKRVLRPFRPLPP